MAVAPGLPWELLEIADPVLETVLGAITLHIPHMTSCFEAGYGSRALLQTSVSSHAEALSPWEIFLVFSHPYL